MPPAAKKTPAAPGGPLPTLRPGHVLVHYPGHRGPAPVTPIPRSGLQITWDRTCKQVPEEAATSLVTEGGFHRAAAPVEVAALYRLPLATVESALDAGTLAADTYQHRTLQPDPFRVVVLDRATRQALLALRPAAPGDPTTAPPPAPAAPAPGPN